MSEDHFILSAFREQQENIRKEGGTIRNRSKQAD